MIDQTVYWEQVYTRFMNHVHNHCRQCDSGLTLPQSNF